MPKYVIIVRDNDGNFHNEYVEIADKNFLGYSTRSANEVYGIIREDYSLELAKKIDEHNIKRQKK